MTYVQRIRTRLWHVCKERPEIQVTHRTSAHHGRHRGRDGRVISSHVQSTWNMIILSPSIVAASIVLLYGPASKSAIFRKTAQGSYTVVPPRPRFTPCAPKTTRQSPRQSPSPLSGVHRRAHARARSGCAAVLSTLAALGNLPACHVGYPVNDDVAGDVAEGSGGAYHPVECSSFCSSSAELQFAC